MDFIVFAALVGIILPWIFITYDIGCQWSKNFRARMLDFPDNMQINPAMKVDIVILSWHINGHGQRCRKEFCLGYTRGAGRTCGEEVETTWSSTNALAPSVREMAPGARHDTLNDHWNGWNFRKIVGFRTFHYLLGYRYSHLFNLGSQFSKKFQEAALMSVKQSETFEKFSATFPPETVARWVRMVERWEGDRTAPNPYNEPEQSRFLCLYCSYTSY